MQHPPILRHIEALPAGSPFTGPETLERQKGRPFVARLGANENSFGPAPSVVKAIKQAASDIWQYADPESYDLKQALADFYGVPSQNIVGGAGIDNLLGLAVRLFVAAGDSVVNTLGGYPSFNYYAAIQGGRVHCVPYRDKKADLPAMAEMAIRQGARILYLANPDNPLGSCHNSGDIETFLDTIPPDLLVILDEAYGETAPEGTSSPFLPVRNNVMRMRTFSKAYGLAGLRCGYAIGPQRIIAAFNKICDHFIMNRVAQIAARAALADRPYLAAVVAQIAEARQHLGAIAEAHGLRALSSATNFVAIDCGGSGAYALRVFEELAVRNIFIRKPTVPGLDHLIRVSTGPQAELNIFEKALGPALRAASQ